jgi:NUMOD3 motif-containing protein
MEQVGLDTLIFSLEARRGKKRKPLTDEQKLKQRLSHLGQTAWNKGKKAGKPSWNSGKKGLQSAWNKGIPRTDEVRNKLRIARTGTKASAETRLKMSLAHKKRWSEKKNKCE